MNDSSGSGFWEFFKKTKLPTGTGHTVGDVAELFSRMGSKKAGLAETIVQQIVEDQFERPDSYRGLWGKRYGKYSNSIFPSAVFDGIELHMSGTASITCSSTIALDLMNFLTEWPERFHRSKDLIRTSLQQYCDFLRKNSGPNGGFGIYHSTNAGIELKEDVRHTTWAIIFLSIYKKIEDIHNIELDNLIDSGLNYIERNLDFTEYSQYRLHTICALHRANEMNLFAKFNSQTAKEITLAVLEEEMISRYRAPDNFWDFQNSPHIKKIDNVLDVAKFLDPKAIQSESLKSMIQNSIRHVFDNYSIPVGANSAGVPLFLDELAPDVGATALLVCQSMAFGVDIDTNQYRKFVRDSYKRGELGRHAYSWHVSCLIQPNEHIHIFEPTNFQITQK